MKVCVVKRRIHTTESSSGTAITINTYPGFGTVKGLVCTYMTNSANINTFNTTTSEQLFGIGFAGSNGFASPANTVSTVYMASRDAGTASSVRRSAANNRLILATSSGATAYYEATTVTYTTQDQVTLTMVARTPEANVHLDCLFILFGGDDLQIGTGYTNKSQTNGGSRSITGLTFAPDFGFFGYSGVGTAVAAATAENRLSFSAAQRTNSLQMSSSWRQDGTVTTQQTYTKFNTGVINEVVSNTAGSTVSDTLSAWNADGITITSGGSASNDFMIYFLMKGASGDDFQLINDNTLTSTGLDFVSPSATANRPVAIVGCYTGAVGTTTANTTPSCESFNVMAGMLTTSPHIEGIGTIQANSAGTAVTGSGTQFFRLNPGELIYDTTYSLIGTIASIAGTTSLTLAANASKTLAAGSSYLITKPGQYTLSHGCRDGQAAATDLWSVCFDNFMNITYSNAGTAATLVKGTMNDFDTRPGYEINYNTVNAIARSGWIATFKDTDRSRRRVSGF